MDAKKAQLQASPICLLYANTAKPNGNWHHIKCQPRLNRSQHESLQHQTTNTQTWSNPKRGLLQRSKRICATVHFHEKLGSLCSFSIGLEMLNWKTLTRLAKLRLRILGWIEWSGISAFPWWNSKDLGAEVDHTWGDWNGLAIDEVHASDGATANRCARNAFECIFAQISRCRVWGCCASQCKPLVTLYLVTML